MSTRISGETEENLATMIYERRAPTTLYADSAGSPRGTQRRPCDARSLGSHRMERQPAPAAWPLREQLLLAQIVHQDGHVPPNWPSVSTHITYHPCMKETPRGRSADTCERVWTALMQAQSGRPVRSFSIGFHEEGYDEATHAAAVAKHLGTDHTELYVAQNHVRDVIPALADIFDERY